MRISDWSSDVCSSNFAHWRVRASLLWGGRMPVTNVLPERWYDTPNIHHVTIDDFRALLKERDIAVEGAWFLSRGRPTSSAAANFRAAPAEIGRAPCGERVWQHG